MVLRNVRVQVTAFHAFAPTFYKGAGIVRKPTIVVPMRNRASPLPWAFEAKWLVDPRETKPRPFAESNIEITSDDWDPFLLKLLSGDRGVYRLDVFVDFQNAESRLITVKANQEPLYAAFFEVPDESHRDFDFLMKRYREKGGIMTQMPDSD